MAGEIGFAIIGTGMIAQFHADAIRQVEDAELRAVYSRDEQNARRFAEANGCCAGTSVAQLVEDPGIHAACVTTPSGSHADVAIPFLLAGKSVLCEKPLEVTLEKVGSMLAAAEKGGGLLAGVFQSRLGVGAQRLKQALEAGRFGRLTLCSAYIKWWREPAYYSSSAWKGTWKLDGGGALMNQGVHAVDLLQWLVGMPQEVSAFYSTLAHPGVEAEDTLVATLRFANGTLGVIEAATSCWPGEDLRIEVSGDKGSATLRQDRITRWDFAERIPQDDAILDNAGAGSIGGGAADPKAISSEGHRRLIADLVLSIQQKCQPLIPGVEARKSVALIRAIYDSANSRQVIPVAS